MAACRRAASILANLDSSRAASSDQPAAVVPRPDAGAGEIPVAHVALRRQATAEELPTFVAECVAPYKRLRAVRLVDSVPRSPSGKLLRRMLVAAGRVW